MQDVKSFKRVKMEGSCSLEKGFIEEMDPDESWIMGWKWPYNEKILIMKTRKGQNIKSALRTYLLYVNTSK